MVEDTLTLCGQKTDREVVVISRLCKAGDLNDAREAGDLRFGFKLSGLGQTTEQKLLNSKLLNSGVRVNEAAETSHPKAKKETQSPRPRSSP